MQHGAFSDYCRLSDPFLLSPLASFCSRCHRDVALAEEQMIASEK
jgi:hypothetical protein